MKKISVAVLAAAMLAGTVTAADVSFSYKGSDYFQNAFKHVGRTDCLSVGLTSDVGGVVVDFDTTDVDANTGNVTDVRYATSASGVGLVADEYYGWMNFAFPLGQLQITGGAWNGRNVNRVLTDRGDLEARDFELFKPGVINGTAGADSANLTLGNLGMVAAWTLTDALPGTLMVKVGLARYHEDAWNHNNAGTWAKGKKSGTENGIEKESATDWRWNPEANWLAVKAGPLAELSYRQEGAFSANLAVRSLNKHSYSFGAWISPELSDTVQMTIGGTVATAKLWTGTYAVKGDEEGEKDKDNVYQSGTLTYTGGSWSSRRTEWGLDFRLRLQVTDDLSLTTMNNISSYLTQDSNGKIDNNGALWNMVNATYQIADNLTAGFTVQSIADLFCPAVEDSKYWTLIMSPSLVIQATEKARVTTSVRAQMNDVRNWTFNKMSVVIPVIFSFNY